MEYFDTGIVHGAGVNDDGSITDIGKNRVDRAIDLLFNKKVRRLILSGGYTNKKVKVSEAESMRRYILEKGVSDDEIILEERALETIGNVYFSKIDVLKPKKWRRNIAITSKWNLLRTMFVYPKILGKGYYTSYVGSIDYLPRRELRMRKYTERVYYALDRLILLGVTPGDDETIGRRLSSFYSLVKFAR